jgi:hypothetical protein
MTDMDTHCPPGKEALMKRSTTLIGLTAVLLMSGSVVFANPALMQKNKPGYPYPGTAAIEHFGAVALQSAAVAENKLEGTVTGQTIGRESFEGKSLLPPKDDPAKISPRPELKDFPLYKGLPPPERS